MSGTFSSFSTALSALRYNRVAMDVASGNVANAGTAGYARRQVIGQATGAPPIPAMWSRWDTNMGDGVQPGGITRMVDPLLDSRARLEHAASSFLDSRVASLTRFETSLSEPGENGIAAALSAYQAGWHDVANNPGDSAARSQVLALGETLRTTIKAQDTAVRTEWADQRSRLSALGTEVNQVAAELAKLNDGLRSAYVGGTDAGVLLDQRDLLTMRLSELTGSKITINQDSTVDVTVAGQALVTGNVAATVTVTGAADLADAGTDPVVFSIGGTALTLSAGAVGGTQAVMANDLPGYLTKLDAFVGQLVSQTNTQHALGADQDGAAGGAFFSGTTAADPDRRLHRPAQGSRRATRPRVVSTAATPPRWPASTWAAAPTARRSPPSASRSPPPSGARSTSRSSPPRSTPPARRSRASASTRRWSTCWPPSAATRAPRASSPRSTPCSTP